MTAAARRGTDGERQDQDEVAGDEAGQVERDRVEELARRGGQEMLPAASEDEVNLYLRRERHQRSGDPGAPTGRVAVVTTGRRAG